MPTKMHQLPRTARFNRQILPKKNTGRSLCRPAQEQRILRREGGTPLTNQDSGTR